MTPLLYIFPISHFSEKARFALDLAKFDYELKTLVPGEHIQILKKITTESFVPVLQTKDGVIQGSSKILDLIDSDSFQAASSEEEREMEKKIDDQLGKGLQTILYHFILAYPEIIGKLFLTRQPTKEEIIPPPERFDLISLVLRKRYKINPKNVELVMTNVKTLGSEIQEIYKSKKFFNGKSFGRVDLTVATLFSALAMPKEAPGTAWFEAVTLPKDFHEWRDSLGFEILFERIREFYREFRIQSR